ncbi:hypothetical protein GQ457_15G015540 [Hibiscus cannabinus]
MCLEKLLYEAMHYAYTSFDSGIRRKSIRDGHSKAYKLFSDETKGKERRFLKTFLEKQVDYFGCPIIVLRPLFILLGISLGHDVIIFLLSQPEKYKSSLD